MSIRLQCSCGKALSVRDDLAGKAVKCPGCQKVLRVAAAGAGGAATSRPAATKPVAKPVAKSGSAKPVAKSRSAARPAAAGRPAGGGKSAAGGEVLAGELDDLFSEAGFEVKQGKTCPQCFASLAPDAVLCTQCGFHLESGGKLQAHVSELEEELGGAAALKKAARDIEVAQRMQEKMERGAGLPWWLLGVILFMLISLTGVGVISVNLARREDETVTFNAVATLLALGGSAMSVVGFGAQLLVIYRAFCEDIKQGLLVFFVPLYVLYYAVTRFDRVGKPLILSIVATSIAIGLFIASAASNQ